MRYSTEDIGEKSNMCFIYCESGKSNEMWTNLSNNNYFSKEELTNILHSPKDNLISFYRYMYIKVFNMY